MSETRKATHPLAPLLSGLSRLAGFELVDRLGLRKPVESLVYALTRDGFRAAQGAARTFQSAGKLLRPERPSTVAPRPDLFDLNLTDEQRMVQEPMRQLAEGEIREAAAAADEAAETPRTLLDRAHALGLSAMAVPEALGGAGGERTPMTNVLVAEELGRGDMGIAAAILAPVGVAHALALWGTAGQQERYLPAFLEEEAFAAALAVVEPRPLFDPSKLETRALREGDSFILNGVKTLVPLAGRAELFLVAAETGSGAPEVFLVERGTPGLTTAADPGMGLRAASLGRLELRDVRVPAAARLGDESFSYESMVDLARLGWCALGVGAAQAVLDYVIPYVNERVAFGEPISHRQSVAFLISDIAIELDAMRLVTWRAASRAEQGMPFHREAFLARTLSAERSMEIGTNGVQLLGGHGFVKEHPVERWYRHLRAVAVMEGGVLV